MFNGKVQKIVSLTASYCGVRFLYHLQRQAFDPSTESALLEKIGEAQAHFDARVFNVPNEAEVLNNVLWRNRHDCMRNSKSMLAQHYFSHKALFKLSANEMVEKLREEKGVIWEDCDPAFKYGTFIKKEVFLKVMLALPPYSIDLLMSNHTGSCGSEDRSACHRATLSYSPRASPPHRLQRRKRTVCHAQELES